MNLNLCILPNPDLTDDRRMTLGSLAAIRKIALPFFVYFAKFFRCK
uniref:Uncharacterized protein n=1 Tax=Rhizophora mucronata TaxID=61149 RepID=A0A2P2J0B7_RHIMU